ncbi:hypothetical protein [Robertmurraya siralis]|uniref:hypothetical protein n=1 Tax=Robertmurraya siralis TaxID=77777 RepID=UPI001F34F1C2|nr:hypothetical protein [Robertmurraya siralis]
MKNMREFYILGLPIETDIGECSFLLVKEYPDYFMDLQVLSLSKTQIIYKYSEINKDGSLNELINELNNSSLFEIAMGIPDITHAYIRMFNKSFNSREVINSLNEKNFNYYRKLIMEINCMKEEEVNPNPEIQRAIERSKRVKARESEKLEFADIISSVVGYNGLSYMDINEFTIYQLYMTYYRISYIKNYDTSTLFATVSADKINIESWSKHINLFEDDKNAMSYGEFKKSIASAVSE